MKYKNLEMRRYGCIWSYLYNINITKIHRTFKLLLELFFLLIMYIQFKLGVLVNNFEKCCDIKTWDITHHSLEVMWQVFQSAFASRCLIQRPYSRDWGPQLTDAQVGNGGAVDEVFKHDTNWTAGPSTSTVMTSFPEVRRYLYCTCVDMSRNTET